jgi:hypothetical protein
VRELVTRGLTAGLLINVTADKVVRLLPPLTFDADEARQLVSRLAKLIAIFSLPLRDRHDISQKHFLQFKDFSRAEFDHLFERSRWIKTQFKAYRKYWPLCDRTLVMIFEKASTRTRLSFEAGMQQLGGSAIYLNSRDSQLHRGESVEDAAQVISRMSDVVMIRTFEHGMIERFAAHSRVPVINGLTNEYHPCQILADIFTFIEHRGPIQGKTVAWIGDSNNVCNTWLQAAEVLDFKVQVSTPPGYEVEAGTRRPLRHQPLRTVRRSDGRGARRRSGEYRRVDLDGFRSRECRASAGFRRLAGDQRNDADRASAGAVHALPAGPSGERKSPRRSSMARRA